jgi:hypothetical protein
LKFYISTPSGTEKAEYDSKMTFNDKLQIVNDLLLQHDNHIANYRKNSSTKKMLFDIGTYLLKGEKDTGVLSYKKFRNVKQREIPLSNLKNKSVEEYLYSGTNDDLEFGESNEEFVSINQRFIDYEEQLVNELYTYKKTNKEKRQWENTRTHKQNMLFSCERKYKYITDNKVKTYKFNNVKEMQEFLNNYPKFTNQIKPLKVLVHNGRDGLIDKNKSYIAEWKQVNTDNEFEFNKNKYKISNKLKQYQLNNDKYIMDSVLCYYIPDENKYYFFDENIDEITKYIKQV